MKRISIAGGTLLVASLAGVLAACSSILGFHDVTFGGPDDAGRSGVDASPLVDGNGGPDIFVESSAADTAVDAPQIDANCGDTLASAVNCGRCGHSCVGGSCVDSKCQPVPLLLGLIDPQEIAVDGTSIYVASTGDKKVIKADKADGKHYLVVAADDGFAGQAHSITVDSTFIYYTDDYGGSSDGKVFRCPLGGCGGSSPLAIYPTANQPQAIAVKGPNVFWAEGDGAKIRRALNDGGGLTTLLDGTDAGLQPYRMALDDTHVYFTDRMNYTLGVARVPQDGGPLQQLVDGAGKTYGLALSSVGLFYTAGGFSDGVVVLIPTTGIDGGPPPAFAAQQTNPFAIIADAKNVYWTNYGALNAPTGAIVYCPLTGCGANGPLPLAMGQAGPSNIALDADAIYWVNNGIDTGVGASAMKVAKP